MNDSIANFPLSDGRTIRIYPDYDPENPLDDGCPFTFALDWGRRDKWGHDNWQDRVPAGVTFSNSHSLLNAPERGTKILVWPVRIYQHSLVAFYVGASATDHYPFNCRWDSGWCGVVFIGIDEAKETWGWEEIGPEQMDQLVTYAQGWIDTYQTYCNGGVVGYEVLGLEEDDDTDSCWGFYSIEDAVACALENCPAGVFLLEKVRSVQLTENLFLLDDDGQTIMIPAGDILEVIGADEDGYWFRLNGAAYTIPLFLARAIKVDGQPDALPEG